MPLKFGAIPPEVRRIMLKTGWGNCQWCGAWFHATRKGQKFDGPACRQAAWKARQ